MAAVDLDVTRRNEWTDTIERLETLLEPGDRKTVKIFRSWNDVENIISTSDLLKSVRLGSALYHFVAFVEFLRRQLTDLDTSFFWGSLACLLQLVDDNRNELGLVPRMIRQLAGLAGEFVGSCNNTPVIDDSIKQECFDLHCTFFEFFTDSILYIRKIDGSSSLHQPSRSLEEGFWYSEDQLKESVRRVERLTRNESRFMGFRSPSTTDAQRAAPKPRLLMLPSAAPLDIFNREDVADSIDIALNAPNEYPEPKTLIVHGQQGAGTSTAVSSYARKRHTDKLYDVVLCVQGENLSSMRQSFTDIALGLKLPGALPQTHHENRVLVQNWLRETDCKWLIVYDNVQSPDMLTQFWPRDCQGKAIITSRNEISAFNNVSSSMEVAFWPADKGSEFLLYLLGKTAGRATQAEKDFALILSREFSGHPMTISQMAGLIHSRKLSLERFHTMYFENVNRVHSTHKIAESWKPCFADLNEDSLFLLGVMSFLKPGAIPQDLFDNVVHSRLPDELEFCSNDWRFEETLGELLASALVKKDTDTRKLLIHGITQRKCKVFLGLPMRQKSFNGAATLIYNVLVDSSPRQEAWKGQLYGEWQIYNQYLSHAAQLKDCFLEERKASRDFKAPWEFVELQILAQRYLYEINDLSELESFCKVSLDALATLEDGPRKDDLRATIKSHQANRAESLGDAERAIELNMEVYDIRLQEEPRKKDLLGHVTNNLGYCYNTANEHETALKYFEESYLWWEQSGKDIPLFVPTNKARCMMYQTKNTDAKKNINIVIPKLEEGGDWAMLAYAYFVHGLIEQRQEDSRSARASFEKAETFWMKGDRSLHPFHGACMYKIGMCYLEQGNTIKSIEYLCESMQTTSFHKKDMPIEHIRNLVELSRILSSDSRGSSQHEDAKKWLDEEWLKEAKDDLTRAHPDVEDWAREGAYDNLIPIFWR